MLSKSQIKRITALKQKKYRKLEGLFVAEGIKVIQELLHSRFELEHLFHTDEVSFEAKGQLVSPQELKKISFLTTPQKALALFKMPIEIPLTTGTEPLLPERTQLVLDDLRDPGNLGTIIRLCDWFDIDTIVCSKDTVDCFNPKVVQATMGSLSRVRVYYTDLVTYLKGVQRPIYGTFMDGENVYTHERLSDNGLIVMGNEGKGISPAVAALVTSRITIPRFGQTPQTESLNVATATAITLSEFKRRTLTER